MVTQNLQDFDEFFQIKERTADQLWEILIYVKANYFKFYKGCKLFCFYFTENKL